ncbi:hypothetical protein [Calothrix sp. 336/3]|uniref:hypothetical protein n=1 Tax=Calothrix sp. 336/3 TaxID=1337936 RepID=UPI00143B2416|nr:hypothetical protein [Calothrix sp. 336/3]
MAIFAYCQLNNDMMPNENRAQEIRNQTVEPFDVDYSSLPSGLDLLCCLGLSAFAEQT